MKKLLLILTALFVVCPLFAEIAPTPQIIYNFNYLTPSPLTIDPTESEQIQCDDNQCLSQEPLGIYGIQKLYCDTDSCRALSYSFKPYQKLVVKFSDGKKRETNVFKAPSSLRSAVQINVGEDSLDAIILPTKPKTDSAAQHRMISTLIMTIALELAAGLLYLLSGGLPLTILFYLLAANMITIPFTWWILSDMVSNMAFLWGFNFVFELFFVYLLAKKKISFKDAAGLVMMANITSFVFGQMITFMLASM